MAACCRVTTVTSLASTYTNQGQDNTNIFHIKQYAMSDAGRLDLHIYIVPHHHTLHIRHL